jgi:ABC-type Fe3+-hydroxamate transport system substrate-binding protein
VPRTAPILVAALALAACGSTAAKTTTTTAAAAATKPKVTIVGQDHRPLVGKKWHYEVRVTLNGKPVAAFIHLQFLFGGSPVGEVGKHTVKNGVWQETFGTPGHPPFPAAARGQPLVLEATVTVKGHPVAKAGWKILVQ